VPAARVWSSACGLPAHRRWVVRADGSASCSHPQGVPRLLVCRTPYLGSVLHARMRVHQSLARARCPIVCTSLSRRPSAAPPALQELLDQPLQAAALIAFESVFKQRSSRLNQPQSGSPPRAAPAACKQRSAAPAAPAARPQPPVLAVPGGAGLWPAGGRQGWPAAGVGRLRYALARPAPGGQRGACGPTPSAGTSGSTVAGDGRTRAGGRA